MKNVIGCIECGRQYSEGGSCTDYNVAIMNVVEYPRLLNRDCSLCGGNFNPFDRGKELQIEEGEEWYVMVNTGRLICHGCGHDIGIDKLKI